MVEVRPSDCRDAVLRVGRSSGWWWWVGWGEVRGGVTRWRDSARPLQTEQVEDKDAE